jgi:hypothetical protein
MTYPEHDKLAKVSTRSQAIGEFLDWLQNEQGITLANYDDEYYGGHQLLSVHRSIEEWLALYFDIDRGRLEDEKQAMLNSLRTSS